MSCDCVVVHFWDNDYNMIRESQVKSKLKEFVDGWAGSASYVLDQRRGFCVTFNYCPYCGKKINWKNIKQNLKEGA